MFCANVHPVAIVSQECGFAPLLATLGQFRTLDWIKLFRHPVAQKQSSVIVSRSNSNEGNMFHWLLIAAQFALATAIVLSSTWKPIPWFSLLVATPGIAIAVWAWLQIGIRRIRIHPSVNNATVLVTAGPYRVVRHPMYAGLLWFTAALLVDPSQWWRIACWIALLVVLYAKSNCEEQAMCDGFPDYKSYRQRVGRFLPKVRGLSSRQ